MSVFETIACLLAYAPVQAAFDSSTLSEIDQYQNNNRIPGWDDWIKSNSVISSINNNIGRVRGEAWGVSNPTANFRSVIGANFSFVFLIRPDQIAFDQGLYRFSIDFRSDGLFRHFPAVSYPDDARQPPAETFSQMSSRVKMLTLDQGGNVTANTSFTRQIDHATSYDNSRLDILIELISS